MFVACITNFSLGVRMEKGLEFTKKKMGANQKLGKEVDVLSQVQSVNSCTYSKHSSPQPQEHELEEQIL